MKKLFTFISVISLFLLSTTTSHAINFISGSDINLNDKAGYKGNQVVAGQNLIISSRIDGDLYCAGQIIEIKGEVTGDVLCAGQNITLSGRVGGDARLLAQKINLNNEIAKNVNAFTQSLNLGPKAKIKGELDYASQDEIVVATGAGAAKGIFKISPPQKNLKLDTAKIETVKTDFFKVGKIFSQLAMAVFGLIVVLLFPAWITKNSQTLAKYPKQSFLWGLLILCLSPILIALIAITIIGIPLALLLVPLLILIIALGHVVIATYIGNRLIPGKTITAGVWLIGYLIYAVLSWIPVIGWIIRLITTIIGVGALKLTLKGVSK